MDGCATSSPGAAAPVSIRCSLIGPSQVGDRRPPAYGGLTRPGTGYCPDMTGDQPYPRSEEGRSGPPQPADPTAGPPPTSYEPGGPAAATTRPELTIDRTRTGGLWVAAIGAAIGILLLLIFILQNTEQVEVSLFGANPDLPLGVALLLAAVLGALIVALIGTARIVQLRMVARRHRGADKAVDRGRRR